MLACTIYLYTYILKTFVLQVNCHFSISFYFVPCSPNFSPKMLTFRDFSVVAPDSIRTLLHEPVEVSYNDLCQQIKLRMV